MNNQTSSLLIAVEDFNIMLKRLAISGNKMYAIKLALAYITECTCLAEATTYIENLEAERIHANRKW